MKKVGRIGTRVKGTRQMLYRMSINAKVKAIQSLIPLGLIYDKEELQRKVASLLEWREWRREGFRFWYLPGGKQRGPSRRIG